MRLFIAIPLSEEVRDSLVSYQGALTEAGVTGSVQRAENLHLTLAFIGEYPDPDDVTDALSGISFRSFGMSVSGTGMFSETLWTGAEPASSLESLAKKIRRHLAEAQIPVDRKKFRPHITLIRRASAPRRAGTLPESGSASMTVDRFSLFRSDRGRNGMIYTELYSFPADLHRDDI